MKFIEVHPICPNSHGNSKVVAFNPEYVVNIKNSVSGCIISLINKDTILVQESYNDVLKAVLTDKIC